jgi:type IV pilus modification protein PilV
MTINRHRHQSGSSLIEVLIALGLVAVTMLGLLGLQLRSLGAQKDSLDRRAAAVLVGGFADRVSVNFTAFQAAGYNSLAMGPPPGDAPPAPAAVTTCATLATCTEADVAARDWDLFRIEVRNRLPSGVAYVNSTTESARITVGWLDPRRTDAASGGVATTDIDPACNAVGLADSNYRCYSAQVSP